MPSTRSSSKANSQTLVDAVKENLDSILTKTLDLAQGFDNPPTITLDGVDFTPGEVQFEILCYQDTIQTLNRENARLLNHSTRPSKPKGITKTLNLQTLKIKKLRIQRNKYRRLAQAVKDEAAQNAAEVEEFYENALSMTDRQTARLKASNRTLRTLSQEATRLRAQLEQQTADAAVLAVGLRGQIAFKKEEISGLEDELRGWRRG